MKRISGLNIDAYNDTPRGTLKKYPSAYQRWRAMLKRCHNPKNKDYARYGAIGVEVWHEWHVFSSYLEWYLDECNKLGIDPNHNNYEVDKDLKAINCKVYCSYNCVLVPAEDNPRGRPATIKYTLASPDGYTHTTDNLNQFCKDNGLNVSNVHRMLTGYVSPKGHRVLSVKGWKKV